MPPKQRRALKGACALNAEARNVPNSNSAEYKELYQGNYALDDLLPVTSKRQPSTSELDATGAAHVRSMK